LGRERAESDAELLAHRFCGPSPIGARLDDDGGPARHISACVHVLCRPGGSCVGQNRPILAQGDICPVEKGNVGFLPNCQDDRVCLDLELATLNPLWPAPSIRAGLPQLIPDTLQSSDPSILQDHAAGRGKLDQLVPFVEQVS
jgi:hypothetical protein